MTRVNKPSTKPKEGSAHTRLASEVIKESVVSDDEHSDTDYVDDDHEATEVEQGGKAITYEQIHKELVFWAGRLELESIDLRDKSSGLIGELAQNSGILRRTTIDLKKFMDACKGGKPQRGNSGASASTIEQMLSILEEISLAVNSLPGGPQGVISLNAIKLNNRKISSFVDRFDKQLSCAVRDAVDEVLHGNAGRASKRGGKNTDMNSLDEKLDRCVRRLDDINNLQISISRDLNTLRMSHNDLASTLEHFKNVQDNTNVFLTPKSSFVQPPTRTSSNARIQRMSSNVTSSQRSYGAQSNRTKRSSAEPNVSSSSIPQTQPMTASVTGQLRGYATRLQRRSSNSMIKSRRQSIRTQQQQQQQDYEAAQIQTSDNNCINLLSDDDDIGNQGDVLTEI